MVRDANHTPGPGPCVWNGNEIVSAAEPNKVVAGLAPDAPDEWGPLFAAAPEMYEVLNTTLCFRCHVPIGYPGDRNQDCPLCSKARKVIAKVRGGAE